MKTLACASVLLFTITLTLRAQNLQQPTVLPQTTAPAAAPPAAPAAGKPQASFLGRDVPMFDPGANIMTWDGRSWNIANNEVFQARFEKYLSAPEETTDDDKNYQAVIRRILDDLAPGNQTVQSVNEAFVLLTRAGRYDIDAHLCDSLADAVYSTWRAQNQAARLDQINAALAEEAKVAQWNIYMTSQGHPLQSNTNAKTSATTAIESAPYVQALTEAQVGMKKNEALKELNSVQMKIEFQALIVQFLMQRRYQHVLMATRFYRAVFADGDQKLDLGKNANDMFANSTGMPPTVATIDSMADEAIRDVREGVQAFEFLLKDNQLEGATKRLAEAFTLGEYMPELRTLPRSEKQQALKFVQQSNQLVSAINVKDYTLAETLVDELQKNAKDFDNSQAMAAIETAKTVADLHLQKAKNALVSGDKVTLESELTQAVEIWPRNPELQELKELMDRIENPADKALADFEMLLSQHNFRQIYNERMRFIAAVALDPKRATQLQMVLDEMQKIENAIAEANIRSKAGDYAGAWEDVETAYKEFPDDSKLNDLRATLTTEAPDFVHTLRNAQDMEQKNEVGSSLAWYLKAQKIYPDSEFAHEGIDRLSKKIMPDQPEG